MLFVAFSDSHVLGAAGPAPGLKFGGESSGDSPVDKSGRSFYEPESGSALSGKGAPKKALRLNSPFNSFPSSALANSSVISSACSAASNNDETDQVI